MAGRADLGLAHRTPPPGRDYERHNAYSEATIRRAAINTMTRRLARGTPAARKKAWDFA